MVVRIGAELVIVVVVATGARTQRFLISALVNLSPESVRQRRASRAPLTVSVLYLFFFFLPSVKLHWITLRHATLLITLSTL